MSVCSACLKPIADIYISAEKKKYHEACLICFQCGTVIQNQYAVKLTSQGETYFCVEHAHLATTAILCNDCGGMIRAGSDYFTVKGLDFHPECFRCTKCRKNMTRYGTYENKFYCPECITQISVSTQTNQSKKLKDNALYSLSQLENKLITDAHLLAALTDIDSIIKLIKKLHILRQLLESSSIIGLPPYRPDAISAPQERIAKAKYLGDDCIRYIHNCLTKLSSIISNTTNLTEMANISKFLESALKL